MAFCPSMSRVSINPSAVMGLTKQDAACSAEMTSGNARHCSAGRQRYPAYISPPNMPTRRPNKACAASPDPAAITRPLPSLPTGSQWPTLGAMALMAAGGTSNTKAGCPSRSVARTLDKSAAPNMSPRSDGLMGAASIATSTSPAPGSGIDTSTKAHSTVPFSCTQDCICSVFTNNSSPSFRD